MNDEKSNDVIDDLLNPHKSLEGVSEDSINQIYIERNMGSENIDDFLQYREENAEDFEEIELSQNYVIPSTTKQDLGIKSFARIAMNKNCMYVVSLLEKVNEKTTVASSITISGTGLIYKYD